MPLLSIPFTWDFPLHLCYYNNAERIWWTSFQFPLLGIFPCITNLGLKVGRTGVRAFNSLYLGFSLASRVPAGATFEDSIVFQFPLLGIFPCILTCDAPFSLSRYVHFQFPLLGIFPCIGVCNLLEPLVTESFQFPLLGIFPCIVAAAAEARESRARLSIPFTWDFPLHHTTSTRPVPART